MRVLWRLTFRRFIDGRAGAYPRKCQTATASPAKPGELSFWFSAVSHPAPPKSRANSRRPSSWADKSPGGRSVVSGATRQNKFPRARSTMGTDGKSSNTVLTSHGFPIKYRAQAHRTAASSKPGLDRDRSRRWRFTAVADQSVRGIMRNRCALAHAISIVLTCRKSPGGSMP